MYNLKGEVEVKKRRSFCEDKDKTRRRCCRDCIGTERNRRETGEKQERERERGGIS